MLSAFTATMTFRTHSLRYLHRLCATLAVGLLVSVACGCSLSSPSVAAPNADAPPPRTALDGVELLLSRASMTREEFEQYRVRDGLLVWECGSVSRGRFEVQDSGTEELSDAQVDALAVAARRVSVQHVSSLPKPEKGASMFADGQFLLTLEGRGVGTAAQIATSLDAVANRESAPARALYDLAIVIRQLPASAPCGNGSFFGISGDRRS